VTRVGKLVASKKSVHLWRLPHPMYSSLAGIWMFYTLHATCVRTPENVSSFGLSEPESDSSSSWVECRETGAVPDVTASLVPLLRIDPQWCDSTIYDKYVNRLKTVNIVPNVSSHIAS
jgi:hypothetical protein